MDDNRDSAPRTDAGDSAGVSTHVNSRFEDVPKKMGMGEKILNIFIEPSSVFKNLYYHNDWLTPFLVGAVLSIGAALLAAPYMAEAQKGLYSLMNVPSQAEKVGEITMYVSSLLTPLNLLFWWLIAAAIIFVLGTFMLDRVDFVKLYSIVAFASMPTFFTALLNAIYKLGQIPAVSSYDDYMDAVMPWTLSLARIFPGEGTLYSVMSVVDVFALWSYWLLVLGVTYGLRNKQFNAAAVVVIYVVIMLTIAAGLFALGNLARPAGL